MYFGCLDVYIFKSLTAHAAHPDSEAGQMWFMKVSFPYMLTGVHVGRAHMLAHAVLVAVV